jgi:GGDEF domain-containing protein
MTIGADYENQELTAATFQEVESRQMNRLLSQFEVQETERDNTPRTNLELLKAAMDRTEISLYFDQTGVYSPEYHHAELGKLARSFKFDEEGDISDLGEAKDIGIIYVTGPELARTNKEAGYTAGDVYVQAVAKIVENQLPEEPQPLEICAHARSGDFSLFIQSTQEDLRAKERDLQKAEGGEALPVSFGEDRKNKSWLVAQSFHLQEFQVFYNKLNQEARSNGLLLAQDVSEARRESINILEMALNARVEMERVIFTVETLKSIRESNPEKAEEFYQKYLQSFVPCEKPQGYSYQEWEEKFGGESKETEIAQSAKVHALRYIMQTGKNDPFIRKTLEEFLEGSDLFAEREKAEQQYEKALQEIPRVRVSEKKLKFDHSEPNLSPTKTLGEAQISEHYEEELNQKPTSHRAQMLSINNAVTTVISKYENTLNLTKMEPGDPLFEDFATTFDLTAFKKDLSKAVEVFGNDLSATLNHKGTTHQISLLEEIEQLKDIREPGALKEIALTLEILRERAELYNMRHDKLTGLPTRVKYYQEIHKTAQEVATAIETINLESMAMASIDFDFLSYFNKEGGRKTGDATIIASVRNLESALKEHLPKGVDPKQIFSEEFRIGGDEIVVTLRGPQAAKVLREALISLREAQLEKVEGVALTETQKEKYKPESPQYSYSVVSLKEMEDTFLQIKDKVYDKGSEIYEMARDDPRYWKEVFKIGLLYTDAMITRHKTEARFQLLLNRASKGEPWEHLAPYSAKALMPTNAAGTVVESIRYVLDNFDPSTEQMTQYQFFLNHVTRKLDEKQKEMEEAEMGKTWQKVSVDMLIHKALDELLEARQRKMEAVTTIA